MICSFTPAGSYWGNLCNLNKKESILPGTENDSYIFYGMTAEQRNNLEKLHFYTADVAFFPKQIFQEFPKLRQIGFWEAHIKQINYEWLENLIKFEKNLKELVFIECEINEIDPRVLEIFKNFERIDLRDNNCVNDHFDIINKDVSKLHTKLQTCFTNYKIKHYLKPLSIETENLLQITHKLIVKDEELERNWSRKIDEVSQQFSDKFAMLEKSMNAKFEELSVKISEFAAMIEKNMNEKFNEIDRRFPQNDENVEVAKIN